jgi:EAL domain-containing protein (putative c-di-GMP-specific phosphodiesterase class I)
VVAEGLQDRMAEAVLIEAGCDAAQGFLVGRPAEEGEITALLMQQSTVVAKEKLSGSM